MDLLKLKCKALPAGLCLNEKYKQLKIKLHFLEMKFIIYNKIYNHSANINCKMFYLQILSSE